MGIVYKPRNYQAYATKRMIDGNVGAFLGMGFGKTVSTLTAIDELMYNTFQVNRCLIIAPKRVGESVWPDEITKWVHTQHLRPAIMIGTEKQRLKELNRKDADVWIINRENIVWLVAQCGLKWPFDMVVVDESSSFKSAKSGRFKALKKMLPFIQRIILLTGTPTSKDVIDLWSQLYLLDSGERLGLTLGKFKDAYLRPGASKGHVVYEWKPQAGALAAITGKIKDICFSMRSRDLLELPEFIVNDQGVHLSHKTMLEYKAFERELVLSLPNDIELTAPNKAVLTGKLMQFANGAVYGPEKRVIEMHREKIDALGEMLEELNGKPVLIFYAFRHDIERIQRYLKSFKLRLLQKTGDIHDWNKGVLPGMLLHPASAGHGLNLQHGGSNSIWFQRPWSMELKEQADARLYRPGVKNNVVCSTLFCHKTIDIDVMNSNAARVAEGRAITDAVNVIIGRYK